MNKKKLLVYANYFYPEVASTSQLLTDLCLKLKDNFDITVICSVPCYTGKIEDKYKKNRFYYEELDGIKIIRVRVSDFTKTNKLSRIKHILSYYFNSRKATKKVGKQDLVYTISQPPILGGMLGVYGKKKTKGKLIYNIQDFNPEQTMAVNYSKSKLILKLMMKFDKRTCKKSNLVITVGSDMQKTLENRFNNKNVPNNIVINNWMNEKEVYPLDKSNEKIIEFKKKYNLENKFIIMYSGNIGLFYDLEKLVELFAEYKNKEDIAFVFVGEGAVKEKLEEYKNNNMINNIYFIPYQDKKDLIYSLNSADVHLVVNAKGIKGVSVPSKIYGVLATNVPIFGILEQETEAWNIIEKSNCGILAEAGNYIDIKNKLNIIITKKYEFVNEHQTGRKYLENNLTKDKSIEKYLDELNKLVK